MEYGKCECGGDIFETRIRYPRIFNGKLIDFDNVPVGKCLECGQKIFKGFVIEKLEEMSRNSNN